MNQVGIELLGQLKVNVNIYRQVAIFGVILPFYIEQKMGKIFTNGSGQAGGGRFFLTLP